MHNGMPLSMYSCIYIYLLGDHYSVQLGYPKTTTATTDFLQKLPERSVIRQVKSDLLQNLSLHRINAICSRSCHATQVIPEVLISPQAWHSCSATKIITARQVTHCSLQKPLLPDGLHTPGLLQKSVTRQVTPGLLVTRQVNLVCCRSLSPGRLHLVCYRSLLQCGLHLIWYSRYQEGQKQP